MTTYSMGEIVSKEIAFSKQSNMAALNMRWTLLTARPVRDFIVLIPSLC